MIRSIAHKKVGTQCYIASIVEEVYNGEYTEPKIVKQSGNLKSREEAQVWAEVSITYFTDRTENGLHYNYTAVVEHTEWVELSFSHGGEMILDADEKLIDAQDGWVENNGTPSGAFVWTEPEQP